MSFSGRTPESLLPRSDSRNPATTCKGITTNGRPCRRALASNSPAPSPSRGTGVLAVLNGNDAAAFYCWQHKDQAETLAQQPAQHTTLYPLKERGSIDTLVERAGILNLDEELIPPKRVHHRKRKSNGENPVTRRDTLPSGWHDMQSPLMTVPEEVKQDRPPHRRRKSEYASGRSNVKFSWACCLRVDDEENSRPTRRTHQSRPAHQGYSQNPQMTYQPQGSVPTTSVHRKPVPGPSTSSRPSPSTQPQDQPTSQTQTLLSLIPTTLSPQITSSLLAELSRPISSHDEAGYIYIFWLTPDSDTSPDDETASSLLDDDVHSPVCTTRRDTAIQRYASVHRPSRSLFPSQTLPQPKRTIMLKIGRAQNVHRRMSQWSKQCGQNITLIRYYPCPPRSNTKSPNRNTLTTTTTLPTPPPLPPPAAAHKVPHVTRVERLIHLELSDKKALKDKCPQCGREHREWFEIDASRAGLKGVDEVVRRWVNWGLQKQTESTDTNTNTNINIATDVNIDDSTKAAEKKHEDPWQTQTQTQTETETWRRKENRIHQSAWKNADRIRGDDNGTPRREGNERGGYF